MAGIHIGLSGYSYKPWQGPDRFYPPDIKQSAFLGYYATRYDTVELDGVWYRFPSEAAVQAWIEQTPAGFVFCPKAHREITHYKRLSSESLSSVDFMLKRLAPMADARKLGPILLQLPPNLKQNLDRLDHFLTALSTERRWAIEFRHESWHTKETEEVLRRHRIAWAAVVMDDRQAEHRDTADFFYARLRRSEYGAEDLQEWAKRLIEAREKGMDCFVYCKHEDEGSPWIWADHLKELTRSPTS
jgi:uncharacterized protein YecE (DUF72 family)